MARLRKQSSAARPLQFLMVLSADHLSPATGLTPTVTLSKCNASGGVMSAFAAPAGAVGEVGSGWYETAGNAADVANLGPLLLHATATGADPVDTEFQVVAFDPDNAVTLGLSVFPAIPSGTPGSLPTTNAAGNAPADVRSLLGTPLGETVTGYLAAAFRKLFDVGSPLATAANLALAGGQMDLVNAPNPAAVAAIQQGLSRPGTAQTITPADTAAQATAQSQLANISNGATTLTTKLSVGTGPGQLNVAAGNVALAPRSIALATFAYDALEILGGRYLQSVVTTSPLTNDTYVVGGRYQSVPYYVAEQNGGVLWSDGTTWYLSFAVGVKGAAYWVSAGAMATGTYNPMGIAVGHPVLAGHGQAVISAFQPDVTLPATDAQGRVTTANPSVVNQVVVHTTDVSQS